MTDRILVVGPSWVGDMVMAQSLFKLILSRSPSSSIDVLAPGWSLGVLGRMPEVTRAIELPVQHGELGLTKRWRAGSRLNGQYERAIILPRSAKSALVPFLAAIPIRTGYLGEARFGLVNDRRSMPDELDQTVKRYCWLGLEPTETILPPLPFPQLRTDPANQSTWKETLQYVDGKAIVALLPGAEYGPAKQWPIERFAEVGRLLTEWGAAVWVLGSKKEWSFGEKIREHCPQANNLCGKTTLVDAIDLLGLCDAAVTNDSGLMHVASAVGARVAAIYGSSSPRFTPPLTDRGECFWLDLDCSPCFQRECPLKHLNCLHGIAAQEVFSAITRADRPSSEIGND